MLSKNNVDYRLGKEEAGFTLLEVLTALLLMGVATSIFLSLFTVSLTLANSNRSQTVAATVAEEYLSEISANPDLFTWPDYEGRPYGELLPLIRKGEENQPDVPAQGPTVLPTNERAYQRETVLHSGFSLESKSALPEEDANFVEVVVNVWWKEKGRDRLFSMTTCVPRYISEGFGG